MSRGTDIGGLEFTGVFFGSFARACVNLGFLAGDEIGAIAQMKPEGWYPADIFVEFLAKLQPRFRNFEPIKERIGTEMMRLWYELGPGRSILKTGVDFLHHQTSSQGYHSVVRGPEDRVGRFTLEHLDVDRGEARVRSASPFDRALERGILLGGMQLTGELVYVEVDNQADPDVFEIRFR